MKKLTIALLACLAVGCSPSSMQIRNEVAKVMSEYDHQEAIDEAVVGASVCSRINVVSTWFHAPVFCTNIKLKKRDDGVYEGVIVMLKNGEFYSTPIQVVDDGKSIQNTPFLTEHSVKIGRMVEATVEEKVGNQPTVNPL